MEDSDGDKSPQFTICDDDGRAFITEYPAIPKFRPGDQVYLCVPGKSVPEGPYIVESVVPATRKYILCFENGQPAKDGAEVDEKDLREKQEDSSNTG